MQRLIYMQIHTYSASMLTHINQAVHPPEKSEKRRLPFEKPFGHRCPDSFPHPSPLSPGTSEEALLDLERAREESGVLRWALLRQILGELRTQHAETAHKQAEGKHQAKGGRMGKRYRGWMGCMGE